MCGRIWQTCDQVKYKWLDMSVPSVLTYTIQRQTGIEKQFVGLISKPRMDTFSNFTGETFYCLNNSDFVKKT